AVDADLRVDVDALHGKLLRGGCGTRKPGKLRGYHTPTACMDSFGGAVANAQAVLLVYFSRGCSFWLSAERRSVMKVLLMLAAALAFLTGPLQARADQLEQV